MSPQKSRMNHTREGVTGKWLNYVFFCSVLCLVCMGGDDLRSRDDVCVNL